MFDLPQYSYEERGAVLPPKATFAHASKAISGFHIFFQTPVMLFVYFLQPQQRNPQNGESERGNRGEQLAQ